MVNNDELVKIMNIDMSKVGKLVVAVDFDGTLFKSKWPEIGTPIQYNIDLVKKLKENGHQIILWTCRDGKDLMEAVEACKSVGIIFDKINEPVDEHIAKGWNSRKIYADIYLDDRACFNNNSNFEILEYEAFGKVF